MKAISTYSKTFLEYRKAFSECGKVFSVFIYILLEWEMAWNNESYWRVYSRKASPH